MTRVPHQLMREPAIFQTTEEVVVEFINRLRLDAHYLEVEYVAALERLQRYESTGQPNMPNMEDPQMAAVRAKNTELERINRELREDREALRSSLDEALAHYAAANETIGEQYGEIVRLRQQLEDKGQ